MPNIMRHISARRELYTEIALLALLTVISVILRTKELGVGYVKNETAFYQVAKDLLNGQYAVIMTWPYVSSFFCYLCAGLFFILGQKIIVMRYVSALTGVLTVIITYLFGKRLYGKRTAFISAFLFTVFLWHISLCRQGSLILDPFFTLSSLYLFYIGLERKSPLYPIASGILLGMGAHIKPYQLVALLIMAPFALYRHPFKRALKYLSITLLSLVAILIPIIYWNLTHGLTMGSLYTSILSGGGFAHIVSKRPIYSELGLKFYEFLYALYKTLSGRLSAVGVVGHMDNPIPPILFLLGMALILYRTVKQWIKSGHETTHRANVFIFIWFIVVSFTLTFLITWLEDASDDPTPHRPPRYLNILYPMPFFVIGLFISDMTHEFLKRVKGWIKPIRGPRIPPPRAAVILITFFTILIMSLYLMGFMSVAPRCWNNIRVQEYIDAHIDENAFLMTNFLPGDIGRLTDISYPLNYAAFLSENPAHLMPMSVSHLNPRFLALNYPYFLYARSPEVMYITYQTKGGTRIPGLMAFAKLPMFDIKKLNVMGHIPGSEVFDVWYVLWNPKAGDGLGSILGLHDYRLMYVDDASLLRALNPDLAELRSWHYRGKKDFSIYRFTITSRKYLNAIFKMGQGNMPSPFSDAVRVNRGSIYLPWTGFGWEHAFLINVEGDDHLIQGLTPIFTNRFLVDVDNGYYQISLTVVPSISPIGKIYAEGEVIPVPKATSFSLNPGKEINLEIEVDVKDERIEILFVPDQRYLPFEQEIRGQWYVKEIKVSKLK